MSKVIAIDPGRCKCGLVLVDINIKKVQLAVVLESDSLAEYIKELKDFEFISKILIGNGTTCEENIKKLAFFKKDLIISEEKNTTFRSKQRYFELFPTSWFQTLVPKELFLINNNLDAVSALIILEDFFNEKFTLNKNIDTRTWLK